MNDKPPRRGVRKRPRRGSRVGDYILGDLLAQGSFGAVFGAVHERSQRPAAVKVLHEHVAVRSEVVLRFEREIEVVQRLRHPNVVQILEHGRDEQGVPFLAMELLEGQTLTQHLVEVGPLSTQRALQILSPLADALDAAHQIGIVHRDIKPANIFLARSEGRERIVLLDFGVAKLIDNHAPTLTRSREMVGTLMCMSPEQIGNQAVDARTDVYGLAVVAFRMLAGEFPFQTEISTLLRELHLHVVPPELSSRVPVPPALDQVLLIAMSKAPSERYPSVGAFFHAFQAAVESLEEDDVEEDGEGETRHTIALYADARTANTPETGEADDLAATLLAATLDGLTDRLLDVGLSAVVTTGTSVLFNMDLPDDPVEERQARRRVLEAARIAYRASRHPMIRLSIACHVGDVTYAPDGQPIAGELLDVAAWVDDVDDEGVFCSAEVLAGLGIGAVPTGARGRGARLQID